MEFSVFAKAVAAKFKAMSTLEMYRTGVDGNALWEAYIAAFPEGSNPIFRTRTEHDCNTCKSFIRGIGNAVVIDDKNELVSIWDVQIPHEPEYQIVANALSALVKSAPIESKFLYFQKTAGAQQTVSVFNDDLHRPSETWNHFFANIPRQFVMDGREIPAALSPITSQRAVFARALKELDLQSVLTVQDLIRQNLIYRGAEFARLVDGFVSVKTKYDKIPEHKKNNFVWAIAEQNQHLTGFRNTVIGTLVTDIASGVDLSDAVRMYESKVAPQNYKRPTALVTQKMIDEAKATLENAGLISALNREFATMEDVPVKYVKYINRNTSVVQRANNDVFSGIPTKNPQTFNKKGVEEVSIKDFIDNVLPSASKVEVLFERSLQGNLVSLVGPSEPTAGKLFKWNNPFSWSYKGELADSIKARVKEAGGAVEGFLCCRLAWSNHDDLDFHMHEPRGEHIYYGSKRSATGGNLDVDANFMSSQLTRTPVENIVYPHNHRMVEGKYELNVVNFNRRESTDGGFVVEIEHNGETITCEYPHSNFDRSAITVAEIFYSKKDGLKIVPKINSSNAVKTEEIWGIDTNTFHEVKMIVPSPNYWGENATGNEHLFFMIEGCVNDGLARGFYNEFLTSELEKYRRVMEMVGSKVTLGGTQHQLSGLGFSMTQRNELICRVTGNFTRIVKIKF